MSFNLRSIINENIIKTSSWLPTQLSRFLFSLSLQLTLHTQAIPLVPEVLFVVKLPISSETASLPFTCSKRTRKSHMKGL